MEFTFGIITSPKTEKFVTEIINTIRNQKIDSYEIIILGGSDVEYGTDTKVVPFSENQKDNWITRKKNLITSMSKFENIVYMHDYVYLDKSWYKGFLKYGNDFEVLVNRIINFDGKRYHDWLLWKENSSNVDKFLKESKKLLLPYWVKSLNSYMYISGTYWVAKKSFMIKNPLNEELAWGEGEDVEWSKRVRTKTVFKFNKYSTVRFSKFKDLKWRKLDLISFLLIKIKLFKNN